MINIQAKLITSDQKTRQQISLYYYKLAVVERVVNGSSSHGKPNTQSSQTVQNSSHLRYHVVTG